MGNDGDYLDSSSSVLVRCEAHPVGKGGRVPRVGGKLKWVSAQHRDRRAARHRAGTGGMDEQDAAKRTT